MLISLDLGFFWTADLLGVTLGNNGGSQPASEVIGKFVELRVTVNFDGFLGGIANDVAVVAPGKMVFQFRLGAVVNNAVEVVG